MKVSQSILLTGTALLLGFVAGFYSSKNSEKDSVLERDPLKVLSSARISLESILTDEPLYQSEITIVSSDIWKLSEMEVSWLEHRIWNHPNFSKYNAEFSKNSEIWNVKFEEVMTQSSDYEGGSMEAANLSLRGAELLQERIHDLQEFINVLVNQ